jgi:hypothetical protein
MTEVLVEQPRDYLFHGWGKRFFSSMNHSNSSEADYCSPSSAKVKNKWSYTSTSSCVCIVCDGTVLKHIHYK